MITYEPKPFLDAAPVNALIHKSAITAYHLTLRDNKQCFKAGRLVKNAAKLDMAHNDQPSFTHSHINALRLSNVYRVYGFTPVAEADNVFTYCPIDSMAGGVSYVSGGISCSCGVSASDGGIDSWWPGVSAAGGGILCKWGTYRWWPGVTIRLSMYLSLGHKVMFAEYYTSLTKARTLTQGVKVLSHSYKDIDCSTRQPVQQSPMIDNAIIIQSRPMSPHAKLYKAIQSGALVYVEVDNEFVAIGKIH